MKICMIVTNMNDFGGLEDFAKNLAVGLQSQGHKVLFYSTYWVKPDNQYLKELRKNNVQFSQLPRWLSLLTANWETKQKLLSILMVILAPLAFLMGLAHFLVKRKSLRRSITSAHNWLQGQITKRFIALDGRKPFVIAMLDWIKLTWKPDLLHIQGYTTSLLYTIDWAHSRKLPVAYEEHQTPDASFDWWKGFHHTINKATVVIAVSEKSAEGLREVCEVTQPIRTVYPMVADPMQAGWKHNPQVDQRNHPVRVISYARLYVTKGLTYFLDAIALIRSVHPETEFRVYGDGPMREELLEYARKLGLEGEKIFLKSFSSRNELMEIMANTDIFVMSSILEGLPLALLESMSFACPAVVTSVGGIPEVVQHGKSALICPPRDPQKLAENICALIENPELRKQIGQAARKTYEQGIYYPAKVCENYLAIYREVLEIARS